MHCPSILPFVLLAAACAACGSSTQSPQHASPDAGHDADSSMPVSDGSGHDSAMMADASRDAPGEAGDSGAPGNPDADADASAIDSGGCGASCAGDCIGGRCITPLAFGLSYVVGLAVDTSTVYFVASGQVQTVPIAGGTVATLANNGSNPDGVAVDATNVYFGASTDGIVGEVFQVAKTGGPPLTLTAEAGAPGAIAVGGTTVYWIDGYASALRTVSVGGGTPADVGMANGGLALDTSTVFFSSATGVYAFPLPAGPATLLSTYDAVSLAVDSTNVYANGLSGIQAIPRTGASPTWLTTTSYTGLGWPGLATDGAFVYFGDQNGLEKIPVGGGPIQAICASPTCNDAALGAVGAIVLDATSVYWTTVDTSDPNLDMVWKASPR
jgi:hypothetical protein